MSTVSDIDESILNYKSKSVNDYMAEINRNIEDMDKVMNEEYQQSQRPSGIVGRIFTDVFGVLGLYLMLFILSDFTRVILTGGSLFGIKWLFWGPYYFFTGAPLLTRIWESKKFLKDLAEVESDQDFAWPDNRSCTQVGQIYEKNCNDQTVRNHPIKDKMGDGLDWIIRHTIGKHFGGILGSSNCEDQSTTIADDCARDKVQALFAAYNAFCDLYPTLITRRETNINSPNAGGSPTVPPYSNWNEYENAAYVVYYEGYLSIYDIGNSLHTSNDYPTNLNTAYDSVSFYCYNANRLFGLGNYSPGQNGSFAYLGLTPPSWYPVYYAMDPQGQDYEEYQKYFQLHYKEHMFDV